MGTTLAAAAIKSGLWLNPYSVYKYIRFSVTGYIADHPRLLKYLAGEIRRDPVQARSTLSVLGPWMTERAMLGGPGKNIPGPDVEKKQAPVTEQLGGAEEETKRPVYGGPTNAD
jgi:hypothetical protein